MARDRSGSSGECLEVLQLTAHPVDVAPRRWLVEFDERLSHSVAAKLMVTCRLARFLSGGLDSATSSGTWLVTIAACGPSVGFRYPAATRRVTPQAVSDRYQTQHSCRRADGDVVALRQVENAPRIFDEPMRASALMISGSGIAWSVTVALSGDGGDRCWRLHPVSGQQFNTLKSSATWLDRLAGASAMAAVAHMARWIGVARRLRRACAIRGSACRRVVCFINLDARRPAGFRSDASGTCARRPDGNQTIATSISDLCRRP